MGHLVVNGKTGDPLFSECCNAITRLVPIEISSNSPFPITMPDHPIYGLECDECKQICKLAPEQTLEETK